jgi:hypothetical protein
VQTLSHLHRTIIRNNKPSIADKYYHHKHDHTIPHNNIQKICIKSKKHALLHHIAYGIYAKNKAHDFSDVFRDKESITKKGHIFPYDRLLIIVQVIQQQMLHHDHTHFLSTLYLYEAPQFVSHSINQHHVRILRQWVLQKVFERIQRL